MKLKIKFAPCSHIVFVTVQIKLIAEFLICILPLILVFEVCFLAPETIQISFRFSMPQPDLLSSKSQMFQGVDLTTINISDKPKVF